MKSGIYSETSLPSVINTITCSGTENTLLDCSHEVGVENNCDTLSDAGVVCQGKSSFTTYIANMEACVASYTRHWDFLCFTLADGSTGKFVFNQMYISVYVLHCSYH